MKNSIEDLNNHLFEQLERLNDEDLSEDELNKEIDRASAMANIATQIIKSGELSIKAVEVGMHSYNSPPSLLAGKTDEKI